ncbi:MAG: hypothetical protein JW878_02760 [Methanomicrobia archaeon]|nr:hypothetical protein [Methanomicrobia archaeon]
MNKNRLIVTGLAAFVLLFGVVAGMSVQAAQGASISVNPASVNAERGDTFTISITVDQAGAELYGAQYVLYYDQSILNATAQAQGTLLSQDGKTTTVVANVINNSLGKLEYAESRMGVPEGVTASGVLATVTFEVIGTSGTSHLVFSDVKLVDSDDPPNELSPVTRTNGVFSVKYEGGDTSSSSSSSSSSSTPPYPSVNPITVEQAYETLQEEPGDFILLDIRTAEEYSSEHIDMPGLEVLNIPETKVATRLEELDKTKRIMVYDQSGSGSKAVCDDLVEQEFEDVYNMLGGFDEWKKMHYPTTLLAGPTPTSTVSSSATPTSSSPDASSVPIAQPSATTGTETNQTSAEPSGAIPGFEALFALGCILVIAVLTRKKNRRRRGE